MTGHDPRVEPLRKEHRLTRPSALPNRIRIVALLRIVGDPACADEYERRALEAVDEGTEADRRCDLVKHALNDRFPPQTVEVPDAGAWRPILTMLGLLPKLREPEPEPKP